ncbi:conopressin/neurophysin-like [Liolophura sinensis]|uniref:conopressin/neurophysin-like n=1 Tax=Liolophura sinensis TaxID=3198878 RepID=UPI00315894A2
MASWSLETTVLILCLSVFSTEACFIRNCPPGGKRSLPVLDHTPRKCMSCGPGTAGQCVGPNICCGPDFGCYIATEESEVCQKENESRTPCEIDGAPCGVDGQGNCVADGVCCDSEACAFNSRCKASRRPVNPRLVSLLQRLLREKTDD